MRWTFAPVALVLVLLVGLPGLVQADRNPLRNAYFGELHVHTSYSPDAFGYGVRATPDDAYRFARGKTIEHISGQRIKLAGGPLDFAAVTDHAEYMGVMPQLADPDSPLSKLPLAARMVSDDPDERNAAFADLVTSIATLQPIRELSSPEIKRSVWKDIVETAERHNEPGRFTTFIGYEFTSHPDFQNLHRNVIFRGARVPELPFSSFDSPDPEALWAYMDRARKSGSDVLAIPHNANLSNGLMFSRTDSAGKPIDASYAELRMRNEPLQEVTQIKGTSETHPALSPNDEFADFELLEELIGASGRKGQIRGSYVREAYRTGLAMEDAGRFNPYKFGLIGSTDSHNASTPVEESSYTGKIGSVDGTPEARMAGANAGSGQDPAHYSASGLAGVWAEENTRESIFGALKRKETFATSGPRIRVRMFGGWRYPQSLVERQDWIEAAYAGGVAMGGDLPKRGESSVPRFIVWALKDPTGANLDRIQIVKGWSRRGQSFEKVYEVALSDERVVEANGSVRPVGYTVEVNQATYQNTFGDPQLSAVWTDPDFDRSVRAFYYARVLEIPTPRWSTYDAARLGVAPPPGVPVAIQERAWSSPIWYVPNAVDLEDSSQRGMKVPFLESRGGKRLGQAELVKLVVGHALRVRNVVTGEVFSAHYGDGVRTLQLLTDEQAGEAGFHSLHTGRPEAVAPYRIEEGRLRTELDGEMFDVVVYSFRDRYLAARSDEFGFLNYEIAPAE